MKKREAAGGWGVNSSERGIHPKAESFLGPQGLGPSAIGALKPMVSPSATRALAA